MLLSILSQTKAEVRFNSTQINSNFNSTQPQPQPQSQPQPQPQPQLKLLSLALLSSTCSSELGHAEKVSDSSIKMITEFSGDSSDNEQQLSVFLRGVFALAKTSDLSEKTTVNVIFRKLTGSAYFLTNQLFPQLLYLNDKDKHHQVVEITVKTSRNY